MADIKEAIRRLIYQYVVEGADKVKQTQDAIAASTTTTDKAALSLEKSFGNLERRYISSVRSQQDYQKVQDRVNAAVAQNPALQERANAVLAAAAKQYDQATAAQKAFAVATSGVSAQLTAMAAGAGPVGTFLAALGPWGFAASVGLGAVSAVFNRLVEGAERIGDKSIELKKFSDVTGLTVTQIKGLTQAGGRLGVGSEEIETSLERFSIGLNEARKGAGSMYEQVRAINPELANQLAATTNAAQGFDILAKALQGATEASQRNALARAAFGRGGIETGLVAVESATRGGIDAMSKGISLTQQWITETARLRAENVQLEKATTSAMDAAYALEVLQRQNEYLKTLKEIADLTIKSGGFKAPGGWGGGDDYGAPFASYLSPPKIDPQTTAGWQQYDDAMGAAVVQSDRIVSSLEQQKNATAKLANDEQARVGYLGAAATEQERINAKVLELKVLLNENKISQETYKRAVGAIVDTEEKRNGVQRTFNSLSDQSLVTAQRLEDAAEQRVAAYRQAAAAAEDEARAMNNVAKAAESARWSAMAFVPMIASSLGGQLYQSKQGGYSQFNPAGYQSSWKTDEYYALQDRYGPGGFDETTGAPNAQGLEYQFNKTGRGAIPTDIMESPRYIATAGFDPVRASSGLVDMSKVGLAQRAIELLPKEQQAGPLQGLIKSLQDAPYSLATAEAIKSLTEKLQQLTQATDANTSATSAQTDVLSPFYSSDPRRTHLGFRAFAGGGIMTQYGELPLRHYQGGGMATSPQVAVFGEGSTPEAYVPVPSGRIPVEIKTPANSNRPVVVNINVMGNADAGTVAALKQTSFQKAQQLRRITG